MKDGLLISLVFLMTFTAALEARPLREARRLGGRRHAYAQTRLANPPVRLHWDEVRYKVDKGSLSKVQQAQLENSLKKWCRCPVKRVERGENLSIRIQPFKRGGVCVTGGPVAEIIVDPSHPDGFQEVMDHEVHHLVEPYFHPE